MVLGVALIVGQKKNKLQHKPEVILNKIIIINRSNDLEQPLRRTLLKAWLDDPFFI